MIYLDKELTTIYYETRKWILYLGQGRKGIL